MITWLFFGYVCAAGANTRGGASFIRIFFLSIGAKVARHFFDGDSNVLDVRIRLSYFFTICMFHYVRIFRFTYRLNLRWQHVGVDGEPYSAGPIRGIFPGFKGTITGKDGNTGTYCCRSFWFRVSRVRLLDIFFSVECDVACDAGLFYLIVEGESARFFFRFRSGFCDIGEVYSRIIDRTYFIDGF